MVNRREFLKQGAAAAATFAVVLSTETAAFAAEGYDTVILNGRVIDPESKLDAVRHIGISGGKIRAVSGRDLRGKAVFDAKGLVVAPGFIDILAHGMDRLNNTFQAQDGVTTILALEGETADVDKWYAERAGKMILNYGASVGQGAVRRAVLGDDSSKVEYGEATDAQIEAMKRLAENGLKRGGLALGFGLEYMPGTSHWEVLELFRVAAKHGASCHVHTRYGNVSEPGSNIEGVEEIISAIAITGAAGHIVHVPSMALRLTPLALQMIGEAKNRGLDITCDCYPYTAFGTGLSSAVFDEGWQKKFAIDYQDLQWAKTGERLTAETFAKYRKQGGMVIAHAIPESAVRLAVSSPLTIIASDGGLDADKKGHPRSAGTFSRVLGHYVREEKDLSLTDAIRKMTLMPAKRLERRAPMMKNKGRIRVGADADITVFDPEKIIDRATFDDPALPSEGVRFVLVNGVPVVREGQLVEDVLPGQPVRAPII